MLATFALFDTHKQMAIPCPQNESDQSRPTIPALTMVTRVPPAEKGSTQIAFTYADIMFRFWRSVEEEGISLIKVTDKCAMTPEGA